MEVQKAYLPPVTTECSVLLHYQNLTKTQLDLPYISWLLLYIREAARRSSRSHLETIRSTRIYSTIMIQVRPAILLSMHCNSLSLFYARSESYKTTWPTLRSFAHLETGAMITHMSRKLFPTISRSLRAVRVLLDLEPLAPGKWRCPLIHRSEIRVVRLSFVLHCLSPMP